MQYLFDSLYSYKDAIELGRWHDCLAQMEYRLGRGLPVPYRIINGAVANAENLFPTITDPTLSPEEIQEQRDRAARLKNFSEAEREAYFEKISQDFREQMQSMTEEEEEQMDVESDAAWQAPVDPVHVVGLLDHSARLLAPFLKSLRPNLSLREDVLISFHREKHLPEIYRAFHGFFVAWDILRIEHEGEPPYKIGFTKTALADLEEILGPDADKIILGIGQEDTVTGLSPQRRQIAVAGLDRAVRFNIIPATIRDALIKTLPPV
jgi:hypothetical protein